MLLLRAREAVMQHFRASLRAHGITEQQWRVLRALSGVAEVEVMNLARLTCLLPPSLSRILRDLEKRGFIQRRNDARDLRKGIVAISAQGLASIDAVAPSSEAVYARIAERFGDDNLVRLRELLVTLESSMATSPLRSDAGTLRKRSDPRPITRR